jgi:hypothetical protein
MSRAKSASPLTDVMGAITVLSDDIKSNPEAREPPSAGRMSIKHPQKVDA